MQRLVAGENWHHLPVPHQLVGNYKKTIKKSAAQKVSDRLEKLRLKFFRHKPGRRLRTCMILD
jgi:hypothetical protein